MSYTFTAYHVPSQISINILLSADILHIGDLWDVIIVCLLPLPGVFSVNLNLYCDLLLLTSNGKLKIDLYILYFENNQSLINNLLQTCEA